MNIRDRAWLPERDEPKKLWELLNKAWRDVRQYKIVTDDVEDDAITLGKVAPIPAVMRHATAAVAVASATVTVLDLPVTTWSSSSRETPQWDSVNRRFVIVRSGLYAIYARVSFSVAATVGRTSSIIQVNGTNIQQFGVPNVAGSVPQVTAPTPWALSAGDTVGAAAFQDSGAALNTVVSSSDRPMLSIVWLGSL